MQFSSIRHSTIVFVVRFFILFYFFSSFIRVEKRKTVKRQWQAIKQAGRQAGKQSTLFHQTWNTYTTLCCYSYMRCFYICCCCCCCCYNCWRCCCCCRGWCCSNKFREQALTSHWRCELKRGAIILEFCRAL